MQNCRYCRKATENILFCSSFCQQQYNLKKIKGYRSAAKVHLVQTDKYFYCQGYNIKKSKKTENIEEVTCKDCLGRYEMSLKCTVYTNEKSEEKWAIENIKINEEMRA